MARRIGKPPVRIRTVGGRTISDSTTETLAAEEDSAVGLTLDRCATQGQDLTRIDRDDTSRQTVPRRRGHTLQGDGGVLGNPDHLVAALTQGCRGCCLGVTVGQSRREGDRCSGAAGSGRPHELVETRIADAGGALADAGAAAVVGAVASIDDAILHLHDDQQITARDGRRGAACANRAERQRSGGRAERGLVRAIEIAVDDSAGGRGGIIARKAANLLGHRQWREQRHREQQDKCG